MASDKPSSKAKNQSACVGLGLAGSGVKEVGLVGMGCEGGGVGGDRV